MPNTEYTQSNIVATIPELGDSANVVKAFEDYHTSIAPDIDSKANKANPTFTGTATFATVAFFATTCAYIMSLFESIGSVSFKAFDTAACSAYMIPILSLYFGRRWTDRVSKKEE